jgi:hypothetical protein
LPKKILLKVKGWKKVFLTNSHKKGDGLAILVSGKMGLKINTAPRHKGIIYLKDQFIKKMWQLYFGISDGDSKYIK